MVMKKTSMVAVIIHAASPELYSTPWEVYPKDRYGCRPSITAVGLNHAFM
jgi:hypothetical protein